MAIASRNDARPIDRDLGKIERARPPVPMRRHRILALRNIDYEQVMILWIVLYQKTHKGSSMTSNNLEKFDACTFGSMMRYSEGPSERSCSLMNIW